jgi:D-alanine-D-alanine ligase
MEKKRVALVFGGKSGEHEVSIASALSIYDALDKKKYQVTLLGIDKKGRWLLGDEVQKLINRTDPQFLQLNRQAHCVSFIPFEAKNQLIDLEGADPQGAHAVSERSFDVIFPVLHGPHGEDGTIQGLFELANIPYVGSGVLGSAVGMDKAIFRTLLGAAGIPLAPWRVLKRHQWEQETQQVIFDIEAQFGYPYFVKPANMGSSVGISKVKTRAEVVQKIQEAFLYDHKILVEKAINARELECSVLGNDAPRASVVGEIVPLHEFYSYEAKYLDTQGALLHVPAPDLPPEIVKQVQALAIQAFGLIDAQGLARVDFFLEKETHRLFLNELNTMPGFTKISMYPKLWEASGISYSDLLDELIGLAFLKHAQKNQLRTSYQPKVLGQSCGVMPE